MSPAAKLRRTHTISNFQDGTPAKSDGESASFTLSLIARGNQKRELHSEKSMNNVRCSLGLYMNYPLANDILSGARKRYVIAM
jgi:hypothetical protein